MDSGNQVDRPLYGASRRIILFTVFYAQDQFNTSFGDIKNHNMRDPFMLGNTTIYGLGFLEGGNAWADVKKFNPFNMKKSAGAGVRIFLPMVGLMGIDWAYGFDKVCVYVQSGEKQIVSEPVSLDGWRSWKKITLPDLSLKAGDEVIVGISVQGAAKGWGTIDDVELFKQQ